MHITGIRVTNYKSYSDSGWVSLRPGFNVLVGRNNAGKTALLDALRGSNNQNAPHRDLAMAKGQAVNPQSTFGLTMECSAEELFNEMMLAAQTCYVPTSRDHNPGDLVDRLLRTKGSSANLSFVSGGRQASKYPSHGLFEHDTNINQSAIPVYTKEDRSGFHVGEVVGTGTDSINDLAHALFNKRVFVFNAERLRVSRCSITSPIKLASDAANLPRSLFQMQTQKALWEEFNANVNRVLTNVRQVTVTNPEGQESLEVRLWPVDPSSKRDDLSVLLADSGTGVGQVLAILCAAMSSEEAVIGIDEPGNFLHPGAIKSLLGILKEFPHQYVVTTHSLDALISAGPASTHIVEWKDCVSSVRSANLHNVEEHRFALAELGVSLADVFGMERVIWVEGETEEACVPIIVQALLGYMPATTVVVRVRSVSELVDAATKEDLVWDVYTRLSDLGGLVPTHVKFVFDRETRSDAKIADYERRSGGKISFLPRRSYENYLLDPEIWLAELESEKEKHQIEAEVSLNHISAWLEENASRLSPRGTWTGKVDDPAWKAVVDAAALLKALFSDLIAVEYRKTRHSPSMTRRLLARESSDRTELEGLIRLWVLAEPN